MTSPGEVIISMDRVIRSSLPDIPIPEQDFPSFIWSKAAEYADRPALTCGISGRSHSFAEVQSLSQRFGAALLQRGLQPGEVLAIFLSNSIEYPIILLGALQAGLTVTTIDPGFKKNELFQQVETAGSKLIVTVQSLMPVVNEALRELASPPSVVIVDLDDEGAGMSAASGAWSYTDMITSSDGKQQWPKISLDAIAILPCSSGTTGERKIVALTHKACVAATAIRRGPVKVVTGISNVVISCLLSHNAGQSLTWRGLTSGANCHILPSGNIPALIDVFIKLKPKTTFWFCYPVTFSELSSLVKSECLKCLHTVTCSGCPFATSIVEEFMCKLPNRDDIVFMNAYGMTEMIPLMRSIKNNLDSTILGHPVPNTELKVVGCTGKILGPGETGELCARGPQMLKGYFNNEQATRDAFDDGWFKTGDEVYYDENGIFHLVGRSKELIKYNGLSVSPVQLEMVLMTHPNIKDAGVIGVPDAITIEKIVAFVVPKLGVEIDTEEIRGFVASQVAPHKKLGEIIVTDSLPRNPTGKILKRVLKESYNLLHAKGP